MEVDGWVSEGQAAEVYGIGFTAGFLASIGARVRMRCLGIEVGSE